MTNHSAKLVLVSGTLLLAILASIPVASAEVITSFNGTASAITSIQTVQSFGGDSFIVNPENGKLLLVYKDSLTNCRIAVSTNGGTSWARDKQIGIAASNGCLADWVDGDSFIISDGTTALRSDNDGITFTTLTAPGAGITFLWAIEAASPTIYAMYGLATTQGHFLYTTNAGATWTDAAPAAFASSATMRGLHYEGTPGAWTAGLTVGTTSRFVTTADAFVTNPTTGNGGLANAWDTTSEGDWQDYAVCDGGASWYGTFTGANSQDSTSRDLGVETGTAPIQLYINGGASRTITPVVAGCTADRSAFIFKQTGDTITPRYVIGVDNSVALATIRQIEDLDASTTAAIQGFGAYDGTIYIAYIDGSGAAARARLIVGNEFVSIGAGSQVFCATKAEADDFGYDEASGDDVSSESGGEVIHFEATNADPAWVGKSWGSTPPNSVSGLHSARVFFTIDADVDTQSSKFRATFTNTPASGDPNNPTLGEGDLDSSEDFEDSVDVLFTETGNDWTARFYYTTGGGARTQFGSSFVGDDPNTETQYMLEVSTDASLGTRYLALKYDNATDVPGMNFTIPSAANKADAYWFEQWFIAESTSLINAGIDVDNHDLSTCIFSMGGELAPAANGDPGRLVTSGSITGSGTTAPDTGGGVIVPGAALPEGWTEAAFNAFLGVILMGAMGGGLWAAFGRHWMALTIGSVMGFILALVFQLFDLWVLIVVVLISTTIIFLAIKRSAGASG